MIAIHIAEFSKNLTVELDVQWVPRSDNVEADHL